MQNDEIEQLTGSAAHPEFDAAVPQDGYRWWYVDGMSEDGTQGIVIIAFAGSVFSPYYFRARQKGLGNAENFCAINVALYRRNGSRWCMTERDRHAVTRDQNSFQVGPSRVDWRDDMLTIRIQERALPFFQPVRGTVRLRPHSVNTSCFALDAEGRHIWHPLAPLADIEVDLDQPGSQWRGSGYFDMNYGQRPLEKDFASWSWSRSEAAGKAEISYNTTLCDGSHRGTLLDFDDSGGITTKSPLPPKSLPTGLWRVRRQVHTQHAPDAIWDLEDTPFYTRSMLAMPDGQNIMHEFLDMQRFTRPWVRTLLPFRMPRRSS